MLQSSTAFNPLRVEAPSLAGFMACCPLYGIAYLQAVHYYRHYHRDSIFMKFLVAILLYALSKAVANSSKSRTYAVSYALTTIITSTVQGLYGRRVWIVSSLHGCRKTAVSLIGLTSFTQFCMGVAIEVFLFLKPTLSDLHRPPVQGLYSAQLATAMTCDLLISAALVYFLHRSRSGLKSTENVVNRLILYSVNVGLVTSAMAVATFVTFHVVKTNAMFTLFTATISKFYVNALLVTLNSRNNIRHSLKKQDSVNFPLTSI